MKRVAWIFASVLAATSLAAAQPGIGHEPCRVTFIHAPDDVRLAIERWVAAEPGCTGKIELRVIPTEGGLYLIAQRPDGRIHERLVPDVDAAGVLVASWVADAWTSNAPREEAPPAPVRTVELQRAVKLDTQEVTHDERWLTAGAMFDMTGNGGVGVRAEIDLARWEWLSAGVSLSAADQGARGIGTRMFSANELELKAARLVPFVAVNLTGARWELRATLGAGYQYSRASLQTGDPLAFTMEGVEVTGGASSWTSEASLAVIRRVGRSWAFTTGPVVSYARPDFMRFGYPYLAGPVDEPVTLTVDARTWMWMGALRREL